MPKSVSDCFSWLYYHYLVRNDGFPTEKRKKNSCKLGLKKGKKDTNQRTEEQHEHATGDATNFGVNIFIKKLRKKKDKAIDHMDCDPLTVGFLHTALHIKDFIFNKK